MELPTPAAHGLPDDATIAVPLSAARLTLHRLLEHEQAVGISGRPTAFVARVELGDAGSLIRVALTEEKGTGHVDVWGHPDDLLAAVAAVIRDVRRA